MGWRSWSPWLKGAILGFAFGFVMVIMILLAGLWWETAYFIAFLFPLGALIEIGFPEAVWRSLITCSELCPPTTLGYIFMSLNILITASVIGSIIGLIIGKVKSKKEQSIKPQNA